MHSNNTIAGSYAFVTLTFNMAMMLLALFLTLSSSHIHAGPFPPAAGQAGSTAVSASDPSIAGWASNYTNYLPGGGVDAQFQTPFLATGEAGNSDGSNQGFTFDIVSLGEGGSITMTFESPIGNGDGADFLVFENSFTDNFLELAWVEVSSNGTDFVRFPNVSLTPAPVPAFGGIDTTDIFGYGGKYRGGFGTPFDLNDLANEPLLDINFISHIRIVDISGDGSALDTLPPPGGPNSIYDPYPTSGSAGFDLEAIGVIHFAVPVEENVPIPHFALAVLALLLGLSQMRSKQTT